MNINCLKSPSNKSKRKRQLFDTQTVLCKICGRRSTTALRQVKMESWLRRKTIKDVNQLPGGSLISIYLKWEGKCPWHSDIYYLIVWPTFRNHIKLFVVAVWPGGRHRRWAPRIRRRFYTNQGRHLRRGDSGQIGCIVLWTGLQVEWRHGRNRKWIFGRKIMSLIWKTF